MRVLSFLKHNFFRIFFILLVFASIYVISIITNTISGITEMIQAITNVFIVISAIFVGYQAFMYKKDYNHKNQQQKIEKAIQLAEMYAEEIIKCISYLFKVYKDAGLESYLTDIKISQMKEFDKYELDELINEKQQHDFEEKIKNIDSAIFINCRVILFQEPIVSLEERAMIYKQPIELYGQEIPKALMTAVLMNEFVQTRANVLNKLEYFSMYFNSGDADDNVIYQSLHQTFFKAIWILYYNIAKLNINGKDKYYTNIIITYNRWRGIYIKAHKEECSATRSNIHTSPNINI